MSLGTFTLLLLLGASPQDGALARQAFAAGLKSLELGEMQAARQHFDEAVKKNPGWGLAVLHLGIAERAVDPSSPKGVAWLEKAVALEPQNPRAHAQLGLAYSATERFDDAGRELRLALSMRSDLHQARYELARVLQQTGPAAEAVETYLQVLEHEPNHLGAMAALAELYEVMGKNDYAETALLGIVRLFPAVPYHRYQLARFYERTGDQKKASRVYAEIEKSDPRKRQMRKLR